MQLGLMDGEVSLRAKTLEWLAACARGDVTGNMCGRRRPILAKRFLSLSPQDCCQATALHCRLPVTMPTSERECLPDHFRSGGDPHSLDSKGRVSWRWGSRHLFACSRPPLKALDVIAGESELVAGPPPTWTWHTIRECGQIKNSAM